MPSVRDHSQKSALPPPIQVENLTMAFGDQVIQRGLSFTVNRGDIFIIMGGSGCGKSTLMRHMIGLLAPASGSILYEGRDIWDADPAAREQTIQAVGILYQGGALWSSMTLAENVGLPLQFHTDLAADGINDAVSLKLALVGLSGFESYYPSQISGGMRKRAALARAIALDPEILFCDEPSAGLDPINASRIDDLILELRDNMGTTVILVTHELSSIFRVGSNSIFLDTESKTAIASGNPRQLLDTATNPTVTDFLLRRGGYRP
jgi:phospholipid/cholesterol/gamma-HCH transport system ATP-binding protein